MRACLLLLAALCVAAGVQGRALNQAEVAAPAPSPAAAPAPAPAVDQGAPLFTAAEVATHNSKDSAWIIVEGLVYDVTAFVPQHPGGAGRILAVAGTDATSKFMRQHGNPSTQWDMLQGYLIGELAPTN